jgi:plasmid maintenance system antidote protein VapI
MKINNTDINNPFFEIDAKLRREDGFILISIPSIASMTQARDGVDDVGRMAISLINDLARKDLNIVVSKVFVHKLKLRVYDVHGFLQLMSMSVGPQYAEMSGHGDLCLTPREIWKILFDAGKHHQYLGIYIRSCRDELGITNSDIAKATKIPVQRVTRIVLGRERISLYESLLLHRALWRSQISHGVSFINFQQELDLLFFEHMISVGQNPPTAALRIMQPIESKRKS